MIYGANGYTGELVIKEALSQGLKPIVAGRSPSKISQLAQKYGLEASIFDLNDSKIEDHLAKVDIFLNCAGPFSQTIKPAIDACIATQTNYLDITGEIDVFEYVHGRSADLKAAGIFAIPGIGFDVVPTDTVAALLKEKLPDATHLDLAFHPGKGQTSRGTTKTMIENIHKGGKIRADGKIIDVGVAYKIKEIPFSHRKSFAVTIPWGDVATAYYSTKIPNIEVYMGASAKVIKGLKAMRYLRHVFKFKPLRTMAMKKADTISGPDENTRNAGKSYIYGKAWNQSTSKEIKLETPEGYKLTAMTAVAAIKALETLGIENLSGALTPTMAFGTSFLLGLEECVIKE